MNLDKLETILTRTVSKLAPWLALAPTGYAIGHAALTVLDWPVIMAVILGAAVEALGIATSDTAMSLRSYNKTKRKDDPAAPERLGYALVAVYFAGAVILTAVLEQSLIMALFPVLSLAAVVNQALRLDHSSRRAWVAKAEAEAKAEQARLEAEAKAEKALAEEKAERAKAEAEAKAERIRAEEKAERARVRAERAEAKAAKAESAKAVPVAQPVAQPESRGTYEDYAVANRARNGKGPMKAVDIMKTYGVPRRTAYNWIERYEAELALMAAQPITTTN